MLTQRQHDLLRFIDDHLNQTGVSPSFDEMKDAMRLKSKSGIYRLITALEERGFLTRRHDRARALEVLRLPHNLAVGNSSTRSIRTAYGSTAQSTTSIGPSRSIADPRPAEDTGIIGVPLYGRIAAGLAVEAPHVSGDCVAVPATLLRDGVHQYYALEVVDDSMTGAGILEGDLVIIRRHATAESGEISVASVDGGVTPKHIPRGGNEIGLESVKVRYPARPVRSKG